jgi:hypothetical protein
LGTWLDWQTQGTRICRNLYYANNRDLFVEVSHGPYLVDHNVFASPASFESFSQGGAFVNNVLCGTLRWEPVMDRATPYHVPHSTQVAGYAVIYGADDRYFGNLFLGGDVDRAYAPDSRFHSTAGHGTVVYEDHPATFAEYLQRVAAQPPGDHTRFPGVKQPVYSRSNVYAGGARPSDADQDALVLEGDATVEVVEDGEEVYLVTRLPDGFEPARVGVITGRDLPRVRFADADYENRDGGPAVIDTDLVGERKDPGRRYPAGPVASLGAGTARLRVW